MVLSSMYTPLRLGCVTRIAAGITGVMLAEPGVPEIWWRDDGAWKT